MTNSSNEKLTAKQQEVLYQGATEPPFTGRYVDCKDNGSYHCVGCGAKLFESDSKFDSGSGWPSFTEPSTADAVELHQDLSHGMVRTEVRCKACGGHLGHVFDDGPGAQGKRYCINSCVLDLEPDQ